MYKRSPPWNWLVTLPTFPRDGFFCCLDGASDFAAASGEKNDCGQATAFALCSDIFR
ncbi:hypothetical protein D3C87_1560480 [compost metagenome]